MNGLPVWVCKWCGKAFAAHRPSYKPRYCSRACASKAPRKGGLKQRFEAKFVRDTNNPENGCWLWVGAVNANGYGSFLADGRVRTASRVAYELYKGPIRDGARVCHSCDTPLCVNPAHLWLGTDLDNARDCRAKGRSGGLRMTGENNPRAVLSAADVAAIRAERASGATLKTIAANYGVAFSTIGRICNGVIWSAS